MSNEPSTFERALALFKGTAADSPPAPDEPVTREMIDLYRRAREIQRQGGDEKWEDQGGRLREYYDLTLALHRLLGRRLWDDDIVDGEPDDEPGRVARRALEQYVPRLVAEK